MHLKVRREPRTTSPLSKLHFHHKDNLIVTTMMLYLRELKCRRTPRCQFSELRISASRSPPPTHNQVSQSFICIFITTCISLIYFRVTLIAQITIPLQLFLLHLHFECQYNDEFNETITRTCITMQWLLKTWEVVKRVKRGRGKETRVRNGENAF